MKRLILGLALMGVSSAERVLYADARLYLACKQNVKNIATACEAYAGDHNGNYPAHLQDLVQGKYLTELPTCPAAHKDTYSQSYRCRSGAKPFFGFECAGSNHLKADANPDRPAYDSTFGLYEGNN